MFDEVSIGGEILKPVCEFATNLGSILNHVMGFCCFNKSKATRDFFSLKCK